MSASLLVHSLLRLEQVAVRRPCVCRAARHLFVPEVRRRNPAVLHGEVELIRDLVVELRRLL